MSSEGVFVGETEKKMELETLDLKWLLFESRLERSSAEANKLRFPIKGPFLAARNNTEKAPPLSGLGTPQTDAVLSIPQWSLGRKLTRFSLFK